MEIGAFRYVFVKPVIGLILAGLVVTCACSREEPGDIVEERHEPLPDQVISDFKITETSLGKKDWTMGAEKAYLYEKRNLLEARVVEVTFFSIEGVVRSSTPITAGSTGIRVTWKPEVTSW